MAEAYPALRLPEIVQRFVDAIVAIESEIAARISQSNLADDIDPTAQLPFPGMLFAALRGFERPRSVDFIAELPRNPTGKVLKRELREPFWKGHKRRVAGV